VLALVPALCNRHLGLGADGVLLFDPASFSVRVLNPDGSEAERSGNGLRIAACHAVLEHGAPDRFQLRTRGAAHPVKIQEAAGSRVICELAVGTPAFRPDRLVHLDTPAGRAACRLVSIGNPHCVVLGEAVTPERCQQLGPYLERHPRFPERTNVQLAEAVDRGLARAEVWERGAGYTLSSGTSASAVAAVLIRLGRVDRSLRVRMPGGELAVRQADDGSLWIAGPAARVFTARVDPADLVGR
jgi:diaminopimelate epimerase